MLKACPSSFLDTLTLYNFDPTMIVSGIRWGLSYEWQLQWSSAKIRDVVPFASLSLAPLTFIAMHMY